MMDEQPMAYIGRCPVCKAIIMAVVDMPEHQKDTAWAVAEAIEDDLLIERVALDVARDIANWGECLCSPYERMNAQLEMELGS